MKIYLIILSLAFSLTANAAFYQFNRFTTNADTAFINGGTLTNILHGFITPFDCGAVGDGITDDYPALQKWLFIGCSSNLICFLPPAPGGSFACSTTLLITNGMNYVNIMGVGGPIFGSDQGSGMSLSCIKITAQTDGLRITNSLSNTRINGILITNSATYSASTHGLWLDGSTGDNDMSSWKNIGVQRFGTNMMVSSGADMVIENCNPSFGGDGLVIGPGTYTTIPVINQIHVRNCQLSYNTNVQCHVFYGQDVLVENCDLSPQSWSVGTGALYVDGHGVVTVAYMHTETYNGKPVFVATDRGNGVGSCTLRLVGVTVNNDGTPGPTSYSIVNTNSNVSVQNSALGDVADGSFQVLWSADSSFPNWRSDSPLKARLIVGGGTLIATNYLPMFPAFNSGSVAANVQEGQIMWQYQDFNQNPGGGIGGGYIWSHLWVGARTADADNSFTTTPIDLMAYYNDRSAGGQGTVPTGISSTNGFSLGIFPATKYMVGSSGIETNMGVLVHSNTLASIPTLIKGDTYFWSSNGVSYVICSSPTGVLTTNKLGP